MHTRPLFSYLPALLAVWVVIPNPARAVDASSSSTNKVLYMVADAHLDDQWNWTIQDTINSYIPNTLHVNFAFFAKYPHYTFSSEEAWRY